MKKQLAFAWLVSGMALMLISCAFVLKSRVSASNLKANHPAHELARLGVAATVHSDGRGAPWMNLTDGHDLLTAYAAVYKDEQVPRPDTFKPVAMASGDYDEDGVPDLISGYGVSSGGVITLHRGNVDAIYPNSPEATQRKSQGAFTDSPFLSPASLFEIAEEPDFVAAGDFDADGHWDVVTAARGGNSLYLLPGDGRGGFGAARPIGLPGTVTSMVAGEINRRDGLVDLVVGIASADGPKVLVFQGPRGALNAEPEAFALPAEATALALAQLDDDQWFDLAIAAGRELVVVHGRDRKLSLGESRQTEVPRATVSHRSFPFTIELVAAGDFTGSQRTELALLADDGTINLLSEAKGGINRSNEGIQNWKIRALSQGSWPRAAGLVRARVSSLPADSLVVVDSANHQLHIVIDNTARRKIGNAVNVSASLDVEGEPVAALPMRLNADALSDLVILRSGQVAPSVVITSPGMTFTVTNTGDNGGINPAPNAGTGTLRQAIVDANANAGADKIVFSIGNGVQTISLPAGLPIITDPVTIDANPPLAFPNQIIVLDGSNLSTTDGLIVDAGSTTVRKLVINRFRGNGILLENLGGNVIEGNLIGTDSAGATAMANAQNGLRIFQTGNNTIGGTTAAARNVISGNLGNGISVEFGTGVNQVQGNFIGTNAAGTAAVGNGLDGISLSSVVSAVSNRAGDISINAVPNNTIGGITPAARNLISGNSGHGILMLGSGSNQVQGNFIGTQANGTSSLGNLAGGLSITVSASDNTIGGAIAGAGNTIAFNGGAGVSVSSGTGNAVQSNSIFSNGGLGIDLGAVGVTPNDNCDGDAGANKLQNFPVLTSATSTGGNTTIVGTLNSTPGSTFRIEFFSSLSCDGSGNGEGQGFIGATTVATPPGGCVVSINSSFAVAVPLGNVITATATDTFNDTSEFSKCVTVLDCTIACPPDLLAGTSPNATVCGTVITFSPTAIGSCGTVNCAPPSGSFFNVGTATVTCTTNAGQNCSFTATVLDTTPPRVSCPPSLSTTAEPGQASALVNYPAATVTDNCAGASVECSPPSGTRFPVGSTLVTCTATDASSNSATCVFVIIVIDAEAPVIKCPANVNAVPPPGQTSAVVNYPPPTVTDNAPGVSVVCAPASGSSFPTGITTVTCTATDASGNKSSCSFIIGVGGPQLKVTIPGNKTAVEFATVPPARKPPKPKNNPCSFFTVENIGFAPLVLTLDSISRTGSDVDNKRIADPNDTRFFSLSIVKSDQLPTLLDIGAVLTLQPGQAQIVCARFAAFIPGLAGKTTGLAASDVLPDILTSTITFRQNAGANVAIPILARVATGVVLIDPSNPRRPAVVTFTRSGNDITVSYAVFDSNLDVSRAKYEFLDANGQVVAGPFEIDLTEPLRSLNLVKGQSFTVEQRFTGASSHSQITGVRLTVFDGETSVVGSSSASATTTSIRASSIQLINKARGVTLYLPDVNLGPQLP